MDSLALGECQNVSVSLRSLIFQSPFWLFSFSHRSDPGLSGFHKTSTITRIGPQQLP